MNLGQRNSDRDTESVKSKHQVITGIETNARLGAVKHGFLIPIVADASSSIMGCYCHQLKAVQVAAGNRVAMTAFEMMSGFVRSASRGRVYGAFVSRPQRTIRSSFMISRLCVCPQRPTIPPTRSAVWRSVRCCARNWLMANCVGILELAVQCRRCLLAASQAYAVRAAKCPAPYWTDTRHVQRALAFHERLNTRPL